MTVYNPVKLEQLRQALLPGVPVEPVYEAYAASAGKELDGKFFHPESSAVLAANAFGFFLARPSDLPPLPGTETLDWPANLLALEAVAPFPWWPRGTHPHLDVLIETPVALVGVESKRYEPFRTRSGKAWSDAYWRDCWGQRMNGYKTVRDQMRSEPKRFTHVDAPQLVKHAFGLRTYAIKRGLRPVLIYLYAEPALWPDGRTLVPSAFVNHRHEVEEFAAMVSGDEVEFISCSYADLLQQWKDADIPALRQHAEILAVRFSIASAP